MAAKRVVVVGNGRMAQLCSEIIQRTAAASLRLVVAEPRTDAAQLRLGRFCDSAGVAVLQPTTSINAAEVVAAIANEQPDYILSIDNFQVFGAELLDAARCGCINFHNGPIARYRGVHAPSWAIFNDEKQHGITWHYMHRRVDAGAVAAEDSIALTGNETGLSLTLECIRIGVRSFERELGAMLAGKRMPAPDVGSAKLYRRTDLPNGGILDLRSNAACIDRLLRATDFRPFPNFFTYARLRCPRGDLIVNEVERLGANANHAPGEIVAAGRELVVACADQLLALTAVMLQPDEAVSVAEVIDGLALREGQSLLPRGSEPPIPFDPPCRSN